MAERQVVRSGVVARGSVLPLKLFAAQTWTRLAFSGGAGIFAAILTFPWWSDLSYWGAVAWAIAAITAVDMAYASRVVAPFPHIAILICAVQYGLAPLAAYYFPAQSSQYWISDFPYYFSYSGPAVVAIAFGWALSWFGLRIDLERRIAAGSIPSALRHVPRTPAQEGSRGRRGGKFARVGAVVARADLVSELEWLLWGGIAVKLIASGLDLGGLAFFVALLADLRFIGLMGLMLLRVPGLKWRVAVLVILEASAAVESAMFHEQILWALGFFALYVFMRRPPIGTYLCWLLLIGFGVFVLNDAKWQIRQATWGGTGQVSVFGTKFGLSSWNGPLVGGLCLLDSAAKAFTGGYSDDSLGNMVQRFNQGWIVDRVLHNVPDNEPYASGETIWSALEASLVPRILMPGKPTVDGRALMARFAGYEIAEGTSMNLGFAGEMYANFGYWGGIVGCGIYALVLGLVLRWVCAHAQQSPLWWTVALYAGHWAFKAETDIGAVLNYIVKAALVVYVVVRFLPAFHAELAGQGSVGAHRGWTRRLPKVSRATES